MSEKRLRLLKIGVMVVPLLLIVLLLKAYGQPVRGFLRNLFVSLHFQTVESDRFAFVLDSRSDYHKWADQRLLRFSRRLREELGFPELPSDRRIRVHLVRVEEDLRNFGSIADRVDPAQKNGYFLPEGPALGLLVNQNDDHDRPVLYHLAVHLLLHLQAPDAAWSPWFAEGLALTLERAGPESVAGLNLFHLEDVHAALLRGAFIPLENLTSRGPQAGTVDLYYKEAHVLAAFLLKTRGAALRAYWEEERAPGPAPPDAFARHFGDPRAVERELRRFISENRR